MGQVHHSSRTPSRPQKPMFSALRRGLVPAALFLLAAAPLCAQRVVKLVVSPLALRLEAGDYQDIITEATTDAGMILEFDQSGVTFSSSDSTIVSVNSGGTVTAIRPGRAEILVKAGTLTRRVSITVTRPTTAALDPGAAPVGPGTPARAAAATPATPTPATPAPLLSPSGAAAVAGVVEPRLIRLLPNERTRPVFKVRFADGAEAETDQVTWAFFGTSAGVNTATGEIIGITEGPGILGGTLNGTSISISVPVEVVAPNLVADRDSVLLVAGNVDTVRLLVPAQARRVVSQGLVWKSTDPNVMRVLNANEGIVQARAPGTAFLNVDGYTITRTIPVRVSSRIARVEASIAPTSPLSLGVGGEMAISARALDSIGTVVEGAAFRWGMQDTSVAVVDSRGVLLGRKEGTTTMSLDVPGTQPLQWPVSVVATRITLNSERTALIAGASRRLTATLRGTGDREFGPARRAKWVSTDPAVLSVDSLGTVTARKPGSVSVIVSQSGAEADTVAVTVTGRVLIAGTIAGARGLWQLVNATDTVPELLLAFDSTSVTQAVWSPDRTMIAAVLEPLERANPSRLVVMRADGKEVRTLGTDLPPVSDPAWTADGKAVLVAVRDGKNSAIVRIPLVGTTSATLASSTDARLRYPQPTSDTAVVLARSDRGSSADVVRISAGAVSQTILTPKVREELFVALRDGKLLLAADTTGKTRPATVLTATPGDETFADVTTLALPAGLLITDISAGDQLGTVLVVARAKTWNSGSAPVLVVLRVSVEDGAVKALLVLNDKDVVTVRAQ